MNLRKFILLFGLAVLMMATTQIVMASEVGAGPANSEIIDPNRPPNIESELQWAWGEVTNLDSQARTVTLKYLDYETDEEKEMVLVVNEGTTFENVKDFNELKVKDTLSVDYINTVDNRSVAKTISFEKPDVSVLDSAPAVENSQSVISVPVSTEVSAPGLEQPAVQIETSVDSAKAINAVQNPALEPESAPASVPAVTQPVPAVQDQVQQ
jgi:hypothetical protein